MGFPRPFVTEIDHCLAGRGGDLQVLVTLRDGAAPPDHVRTRFDQVFRDLSDAAMWGAMAGQTFVPASSFLKLLTPAGSQSRPELLWTFAGRNVDPGCLLVIENLIHAQYGEVGGVASLRLGGELALGHDSVGSELPGDFEPYPFTVEYGFEDPQVLVDVTFADRQDVEKLAPFRIAWRAWEGIAIRGGFADATYRPGHASMMVKDDLRIVSTGLGAAYGRVSIADAGFYCLVNMLQTLHDRGVPIESVEIE
ncbi:hypothetical protein AWB82_04410 [Caballeronia glebae]|uniref:Uncharacterized protein n=1 Tax=Caballeronia glebae TaxID=1777143 RepID=A0A158BQ07_9BURK|nr:hypothetical protein [Caballeronia glebae]SAK72168.1 hypothetical protein AWB82_04410 [Caballeronia glebae]